MSRYRRLRRPGATSFFTVNLADGRSSALTDHIADLRAAFAGVLCRRPFHIDAIAVLPDHLHTVWTLPEGDSDFSTRWKEIKTTFTRRTGLSGPCSPSKQTKGERGLWQRRFWEHLIRNESDYHAHVGFCWSNPVRHGLVARPSDWPHSSIHREIRSGHVAPDWVPERWVATHPTGENHVPEITPGLVSMKSTA